MASSEMSCNYIYMLWAAKLTQVVIACIPKETADVALIYCQPLLHWNQTGEYRSLFESRGCLESPDTNFLIVLSQIRFVDELLKPSTMKEFSYPYIAEGYQETFFLFYIFLNN